MLFEVPWPKIVSLVEELYPQDARELKLMTGEEAAATIRAGGNNNPAGRNQHNGSGEANHADSMSDLFAEPEPPARKKTKQGTSAGCTGWPRATRPPARPSRATAQAG
jgi:hypothetical protein